MCFEKPRRYVRIRHVEFATLEQSIPDQLAELLKTSASLHALFGLFETILLKRLVAALGNVVRYTREAQRMQEPGDCGRLG